MWENMKEETPKDMDSITGRMGLITEDNFCLECGMEEASGRWSMVIAMRAST